MKVCAIIITFNRIDFLMELVKAVRNQTRKPDAIIVVNNSSTDGTSEWLANQSDLTVITQENIGSSGGQWRGLKEAFDSGFDWIWTMDDDVVPDFNSLELLLNDFDENKIRAPLRYTHDGKPFFNDVISYNLTNPFKSIWKKIISEKDLVNEYTEAVGITFEGPLFHRSLIQKIGLPEKNFFIYGDDTEYFIRAWKAGFKTVLYRNAILKRKLPYNSIPESFNWKTYYLIRNIVAIDKIHGNFAVRLLRPFGYLLVWMKRSKLSHYPDVFKAFIDGIRYKSLS